MILTILGDHTILLSVNFLCEVESLLFRCQWLFSSWYHYLVEIYTYWMRRLIQISNTSPHQCQCFSTRWDVHILNTTPISVMEDFGHSCTQFESNVLKNCSTCVWCTWVWYENTIQNTILYIQRNLTGGTFFSRLTVILSGPFYQHGFTLITALISNYIHYKACDEVTYPFLRWNHWSLGFKRVISYHTFLGM